MRTPRELLQERGEFESDVIAVRVNGDVVDLQTPIDPEAHYQLVRRTDAAGLEVIRHSTSHVMADAVQRLFPGTKVTIGPAVESGFYYDFDRPDGAFTDRDLARIEKEMRRIMKQKLPFRRQELSRDEAKALFERMGETYKLELIDKIPEGDVITIYTHGKTDKPETQWTDLCAGPHVPSTEALGVVKLTSVAGAYWRGDENNPMLQRIYGTAFATQEDLETHLRMLKEAKERDHRKLGKELELFMFHDFAPAMPFFLPKGAFVYNRLVEYIRQLYVEYGYDEVITPQIFDARLFEQSGHLANYRENMYLPVTADVLDTPPDERPSPHGLPPLEALAQKPMNCPGHCLIFGQRRRSYRELPWRIADFGRLHRYERGGVVHGLTRVRTMQQDDAHIFCSDEQVRGEVVRFNRLLFEVYHAMGFSNLNVKLALRPDKRVGTDAQWDAAERALAEVLQQDGLDYEALEGEGAFYGPKLEFHVKDAIGRSWQLGTIQLDYALPERFGLEYVTSEGSARRPVMLHRAILGTVERFLGIYIEHCAGKFPTWLAPTQVVLATVSEKQAEYAEQVRRELAASGLRVALDDSADKLGAKIRKARMARVPYIGVLGEKEAETQTITPRSREEGDLAAMPIAAFAQRLATEAKPPRLNEPR
jgi:threonyl-tRNA synthetase